MVNDEPLPRWKSGPIWTAYFHQLGDQGWEFVEWEKDFIDEPAIGGKIAIFKRPRESGGPQQRSAPPFINE